MSIPSDTKICNAVRDVLVSKGSSSGLPVSLPSLDSSVAIGIRGSNTATIPATGPRVLELLLLLLEKDVFLRDFSKEEDGVSMTISQVPRQKGGFWVIVREVIGCLDFIFMSDFVSTE